jgi:tetratricopeptide (TPR) repeat protein
MNAMLRLNCLVVGACLAGARIFAAETNQVSSVQSVDTSTQSMVNAYLQIQEQIHDTQLAIEQNRQQSEAEARRNMANMTARIEALQQIIAAQRQGEAETAQRTQQLMLILGGAFGTIGLVVLSLMAHFQWRAVTRLVEMSSMQSRAPALAGGRALPMLETGAGITAPTGAAVELSTARLLGVIERLEKRILELEQTARAPLKETTSATVNGQNGTPAASNDLDECVASLLAEGQSLVGANEPEKALECFDEALGLQPKHAEALVKKGGALEKLGRLDEAIACYDRALEANDGMTIAYLHKGGLFNRMARYDEALQCYEQALRTQEKKTPVEKAAA